ncbi:MAG: hypothetical protein QF437_28815 [Planctomycetota bacterium]|jgi:hypothetical protein|nr:hypothetical protein [Planctomycetota bacterium]MDP7134532.1 hypothetical protein [Planctomycetota bacterium]MDP7251886.1 hypothetical protein [Planctomycetota bacterium]
MTDQTLAKRVDALEKELKEIKQVLVGKPPSDAWLKTAGMFDDDPGIQEVHRLGREFRQKDRELSKP